MNPQTHTANDIAQQKQAMKKAGETVPAPARGGRGKKGGAKGGRPRAQATAASAEQPRPAAGVPAASPVDLIDKTLDLAAQAGGVAALKRLVDRLADMQKW